MSLCRVDNVDIHYSTRGTGPDLLLAFCLGGNSGMWGDEIGLLARQHRVTIWDPRGHGASDSPADAAAYGVGRSADDLLALMDHLEIERAIVGGVSMGGGIAACFASRYPQRTRAALVIDSNTAAGLPVAEKVVATREQTIRLCEAGNMQAVADFFLETSPSYRLFGADSPDMRQRLNTMIASMNPTGFAHTLRSMLQAETTTEDLKQISAPTLVLCGEKDPAIKAVELTAATIPDNQFSQIQDAGHLSNIDQPQAFAREILAFTKQLRV